MHRLRLFLTWAVLLFMFCGIRRARASDSAAVDRAPAWLPTIESVTSTNGNGAYGAGDTIDVTLKFSRETRLARGTLRLTFDTGATLSIYPFTPTRSVSATYVVRLGDRSPDLDVTSLTLDAGAVLQDIAGNDLALGLPAAGKRLAESKDLVIADRIPKLMLRDVYATGKKMGMPGRPVDINALISNMGGEDERDMVLNITVTNRAGMLAEFSRAIPLLAPYTPLITRNVFTNTVADGFYVIEATLRSAVSGIVFDRARGKFAVGYPSIALFDVAGSAFKDNAYRRGTIRSFGARVRNNSLRRSYPIQQRLEVFDARGALVDSTVHPAAPMALSAGDTHVALFDCGSLTNAGMYTAILSVADRISDAHPTGVMYDRRELIFRVADAMMSRPRAEDRLWAITSQPIFYGAR